LSKHSIEYAYTHIATEATTGYFSCEPTQSMDLEQALKKLRLSPLDEFLHSYTLRLLYKLSLEKLKALIPQEQDKDLVLCALLLECAILNSELKELSNYFPAEIIGQAIKNTPLIYIEWDKLADTDLHQKWGTYFKANIDNHNLLPHPDDDELALLYEHMSEKKAASSTEIIKKIRSNMLKEIASQWSRPPAQETALHALEVLVDNGIIADVEMRHEDSLSPIALLRKWNVSLTVKSGSLDYSLNGLGTTYGRGLSVAAARASYAMEMIERACAYASIADNLVLNTVKSMPLVKASYSQLKNNNILALDPNTLPLEVLYQDFELHWVEAELASNNTCILVPAQIVYLFCNLDEKALYISAGSTGLASGNTLAEAKLSALSELLERDAEATMPYARNNCFLLKSNDAKIQSLLDDYANRGIQIQFQDITTKFGIPCYQCFVREFKGTLIKATGANIDGAKAALSALTEVPYPYPNTTPTAPALKNLPTRILEELPAYNMESPTRDLKLVEKILQHHGLDPIYVEITRDDLDFPVVRAIIPQLELTSEFDKYTRIRQPLFNNYLNMFK